MAISSHAFVDRSPWVYLHVAEDAREAFENPSKAAELTAPLLNLYRLLDRYKHSSFVVSYPPGVLKGGTAQAVTVTGRPRHLKLMTVESALKSALETVYKGEPASRVIEDLQNLISDLVENREPRAVARLQQGSKFLKQLASRLDA
jgi:hypothetical protein